MKNPKQNVKLYKISRTFYELKDFNTTEERVHYIIRNHKEKVGDIENPDEISPYFETDSLKYFLYVFTQGEKVSLWKEFLPAELTIEQDFLTKETSFVLFIANEFDIYAVIGGRGIQVIKRYLNHTFGIDTFARIAEPEINLVQSVKSRGITGNVAGNSAFFRNEHRLIDTISFGNIHTEINFEFREETIVDVFDFLNIDDDRSLYGLAGASFAIKTKMTFNQLNEFVKRIIEIEKLDTFKPLSSFIEVTDSQRISSQIRPSLFEILREDIIKLFEPQRAAIFKFDFDFCHPSKMALFYECDTFKVYKRNSHKPFFIATDRADIYKGTMKYIYNNINYSNLWELMSFLGGVMVKGFKQDDRKTKATFIDHISCEIDIEKVPFFCIDTKWYKVRGEFLNDINNTCQRLMRSNQTNISILPKKWINPKITNEDEYNLLYKNEDNYLVLDKILGNNIELCDIVFETKNQLFLVHVKKGFDSKMRDLTNQILISSKRLWDDLKSNKLSFLNSIYDRYAKSINVNTRGVKSQKEFKDMFQKEIVYVLAFVSTRQDNFKIIDDISRVKSNIAKFSTINCIREMKENSYPLQIIEIDS